MTSFSLQDSAGPLEIMTFPRGMSACGGGCQDHTKCLELGMTELQKTCGYQPRGRFNVEHSINTIKQKNILDLEG